MADLPRNQLPWAVSNFSCIMNIYSRNRRETTNKRDRFSATHQAHPYELAAGLSTEAVRVGHHSAAAHSGAAAFLLCSCPRQRQLRLLQVLLRSLACM
jgi:hypothetical protein